MLNRIIQFSLNNRLLVLGAALLLCLYGIYCFTLLPIDVLPNLNRPQVTILTEAPGLAPEEVETQITYPIESVLTGAPDVHRVRSASISGLSMVWVDFDWNSHTYHSRQVVSEKLQQVQSIIPPGVSPVMGPISSIMGEIMLIGLTSKDESIGPMEIRTIADWTIRPRLLAVDGVAQISVIGGEVKQYHIIADPQLLVRNGVSLSDLEQSINAANQNFSGGFLVNGSQEKVLRTLGRFRDIEDIRNSPVKHDSNHSGHAQSLQIQDLAKVKVSGPLTKRGDAGVNTNPAVILIVQKQPQADTLKLTSRIEQELEKLRIFLPESIQIHDQIFKQSNFIKHSTKNVQEVLRDGAILVLIVLFLFLLNFRTTIITLTAIPLSLVVSIIVFRLLDLSINTMTLGGLAIAIGELVDDAIVDVENIFRRLRENNKSESPLPTLQVVYDASREIRASIVNATLIVILVFIPLFAMGGVEGRLFMPIGIAYVTSIVASLIVALTVTPVLAYYLIPRSRQMEHTQDSAIVSFLKGCQRYVLDIVLKFKDTALATTGLLFVASLLLATTFGREFLPPFNEGALTVNIVMPPGTSLDESNRIGMLAEKLLLQIPEISETGRRVGRAELDEHAQGVHITEIEFELVMQDREKNAVMEDVRERLRSIPGISVNVGQPISHRIDHLLSGVRSQIAIKIFGASLYELRSIAREIREIAREIPGITDLQIERQTMIPQLHIQIDRDLALQYGVSIQEIGNFVETALRGRDVSRIIEGQKTFDVVLRIKDGEKRSTQEIAELPILTEDGRYVPLGQVAQLEEALGPNAIMRENASGRIVVSANVAGRDLVSTIEHLQQELQKRVSLPEGYFLVYGGQFESESSASKLIYWLGLVALLAIFIVLLAHFRNINLALQVMLAVPFAFIGAMFGVYLTSGVLSIASLVGLITLTGIATRNGIMMIDHYLHLMKEEGENFDLTMLYRGTAERLVPVLMTALTAILALTPILVGGNEPGKEILYPVAVVIFSGLFSSTALNLLITPVIFWSIGKRSVLEVIERNLSDHK